MTSKKKIRWRNMGGTFRTSNRKIKPNQVFTATIDEIPQAFRDVIVPVDELPKEPEPVTMPLDEQYTLQQKTPGWYEIIDVNGKVVSEKAMRKEEAENVLEALTQ